MVLAEKSLERNSKAQANERVKKSRTSKFISRRDAETQRPETKESSCLFRTSASQRLCASLFIFSRLQRPGTKKAFLFDSKP